jgi:hypothetical protein
MNGNRGSKHFIYINRTFFGLYNLMFDLKSTIKVNDYLDINNDRTTLTDLEKDRVIEMAWEDRTTFDAFYFNLD